MNTNETAAGSLEQLGLDWAAKAYTYGAEDGPRFTRYNIAVAFAAGINHARAASETVAAPADGSPERPFQLGDVVMLKSGGALLTIVSIGCCGSLGLAYSKAGAIEELDFERPCLRHATEAEIIASPPLSEFPF